MGNMVDYVKEAGKLDFESKPFGPVDSLVISELSYFKYDGIVPGFFDNKKAVSFKQISHIDNLDSLFQGLLDVAENRALLLAAANSKRFGKMKLNYYINEIDEARETQFSAVTFFMDEGNTYIAFRGTDETIIGWKEDFNMGFLSPVPGQVASLAYLREAAGRFQESFIVGGHSKGGNEAVYASMMAEATLQERIRAVYSHDGPGFKDAVFEEEGYCNIKEKIRKMIPRSSVVGLLLQHQEDYTVVRSSKAGLLQHDPFTWIVENGDFMYLDDVDKSTILMNKTLNQWIGNMEEAARKELVDTIFGLISTAGLSTTLELSTEWRMAAKVILGAGKEIDGETRKFLREMLRQLMRMGSDNLLGLKDKDKNTHKRRRT